MKKENGYIYEDTYQYTTKGKKNKNTAGKMDIHIKKKNYTYSQQWADYFMFFSTVFHKKQKSASLDNT